MAKEDLELLQAVRDWQPPTTLHPIARQAAQVYERNGNALPPSAVEEIRGFLNAFGKDDQDLKGLAEAIEGLTRFMIVVTENLNDKESGAKVGALMREKLPLFEPFWERVGEALTNVSSEAKGSFLSFIDQERAAEKSAPVFGEAAPQGSVPLRNLAPPERPPAWVAANKKTTARR
ncbi:MAG: hypothetical protein IT384_15070 [Deltaproteobacteria bacterium]|nr:hypothetical protein [Deltaproteobacteria bacterium]